MTSYRDSISFEEDLETNEYETSIGGSDKMKVSAERLRVEGSYDQSD